MKDDASTALRSHRFRTGDDADVDAFLLVDGRFFLFAHLKNEKLCDDACARAVASEFEAGAVVAVGRAFKTDRRSVPLEPVWSEGETPRPELWTVERDVRFRLETGGVLNPGLFLDQRENRRRLAALVHLAREERPLGDEDGFLNLFSYTGSFSVTAHRAGARTTSVDVSARYLDWERKNFEGNFPDDAGPSRRFREDARDFLRRARKKGARYRWIVLDPPTFSRGPKKAFRAQDDLLPLLDDALACLATDRSGAVLVSMNDSRWDTESFHAAVSERARASGTKVERGVVPEDFGPAHPMKSCWVLRES